MWVQISWNGGLSRICVYMGVCVLYDSWLKIDDLNFVLKSLLMFGNVLGLRYWDEICFMMSFALYLVNEIFEIRYCFTNFDLCFEKCWIVFDDRNTWNELLVLRKNSAWLIFGNVLEREMCLEELRTGNEILRRLIVLNWFVNYENSELYWERWFDLEWWDCDLYFWEMSICVVVDPWQMSTH